MRLKRIADSDLWLDKDRKARVYTIYDNKTDTSVEVPIDDVVAYMNEQRLSGEEGLWTAVIAVTERFLKALAAKRIEAKTPIDEDAMLDIDEKYEQGSA